METHEVLVLWWAHRIKNPCLKIFTMQAGLSENSKHKIGLLFVLYKWATILCTLMQNSIMAFWIWSGHSVCMIKIQYFLNSWEKKAEMWRTFRRHSRQWNSSFAAPQWNGCISRMWKPSLLWRTRKVTKPSWKNVRKWWFTTLENLAVAKGLINLPVKRFSCFQRRHGDTQHIVVVERDLRTFVPALKHKVLSLLVTIPY